MKVDPLDALSVAFPYPEFEDFQEEVEGEEYIQVEEDLEENRITEKDENERERENKKKEETENEQLQVWK